ncbi:hypothetical protein V8G54_009978 [Vigna mungo]|uniref:Uncharacterized protein n=1 Tax=Vigna mungo TaxID=3915 RepID=A0AAQ3S5Z7_VIGMU
MTSETRGISVIDGSTTLPPHLAANYPLKFIDFMHAVMTTLIVAVIVLFDHNVVNCLFPHPLLRYRKSTQHCQWELTFWAVCSSLNFLKRDMELNSSFQQINSLLFMFNFFTYFNRLIGLIISCFWNKL